MMHGQCPASLPIVCYYTLISYCIYLFTAIVISEMSFNTCIMVSNFPKTQEQENLNMEKSYCTGIDKAESFSQDTRLLSRSLHTLCVQFCIHILSIKHVINKVPCIVGMISMGEIFQDCS